MGAVGVPIGTCTKLRSAPGPCSSSMGTTPGCGGGGGGQQGRRAWAR
jgi:hypothetical protein